MNDGRLVVNFGALTQATVDIKKAISTLESSLSQLESDAQPLVDTWGGQAREAYELRQRRWSQSSAHLQAILRKIEVAVQDSADDYLATEKRATQLFD